MVLISVFLALGRAPVYTARPRIASCGVSVCSPILLLLVPTCKITESFRKFWCQSPMDSY